MRATSSISGRARGGSCLAILAFMAVVLVPRPADAIKPCSLPPSAVGVPEAALQPKSDNAVVAWLKGWWSGGAATPVENAAAGGATAFDRFTEALWQSGSQKGGLSFTVDSGFSTTLECQADGMIVPQPGLYFPIGLVVMPLGTFAVGGQEYVMVEAEHGLRMYLGSSSLKQLDKDREYFFANSHQPKPYCIGQRSCVGDDKSPNVLTATARYAVSKVSPGPPFGACGPREVEIFDRGGKLQRTKSRIYLDPCHPGKNPASDGRVKTVSFDQSTKLFDSGVRGSYHRLSDSLVARLFSPDTRATKECGQKRTVEVETKVTGKVEAGATLYILKASTSAELQRVAKWVTEQGPKTYITASTYLLDRAGKLERNSVVAIAVCDANEVYPSQGHLLSVRHPSLGHDEISITRARVIKTYSDVALHGLVPVRLSAPRPTGPVTEKPTLEDATTTALRSGQFWEIRGADQYFLLRDAIASQVGAAIEEIRVLFGTEAEERAQDFFTHLVLAATARFVPQKSR